MNEKLLDKATRIFKSLDLSEICVEDGDFKLTMRRQLSQAAAPVAAPRTEGAEVFAPAALPRENAPVQEAYMDCKEIKAPLVGVFYAAKSPDSAPFVKLGDKVKKGDVVCILEAMKMMNEICADCDGTVLDICAENGSIVEYGQTLFKLG